MRDSTHLYSRILGPAVVALLASLPVFAQLEDRTPTGGSNITTRKCVGGANEGTRCNSDSDCNSNNCFDYNIVDLTVNFRTATSAAWTPTAGQMTTIRGYFTAINNTVADITDGQMVLGTISLVVNNGAPNATVQLKAGQCNAGTLGPCLTNADCAAGACNVGGGSTNTGGWGADGKITVGIGCLQNPLCFSHEFMHLIANVRDEYEGALDDTVDNDGDGSIDECNENQSDNRCFGGTNDGQPCAAAAACPGGACRRIVCIDSGGPDPTTAVGCLMRCCLANTDSDLCWAGNHDPNIDTEQSQCRNNNDCWTQFGQEWPSVIQVPAGAPDAGPAVAPAAVGFLTPSVLDRFVAVIDRSGSMDSETPKRIDVSKTTVKDFIDLLGNGTAFGLASFSTASSKDFPPEAGLRALNAAADRTAAKTAVDGLSAGGTTRIGAGLMQGRSMLLEAGGAITLNTVVLLLTDGLNNEPPADPQADLDAALAALAADSIPVFVTCIGEGRDSVQCSYIADRTAGRFVDSAETENLYDAFVEFAALAQGNEFARSQLGTPISDGGTATPISAWVEEGVSEARFLVSWTKPTTNLDLKLYRPDGTEVPAATKILASQGESYVIPNPPQGNWTLQVVGTSVPGGDAFSARTIVDHQMLNVGAGLARSTVAWPDGFLITANPSMGATITGCDVIAVVQRPDGTTASVALDDDGTGADSEEHDGLYEAEFRDFTAGDGIHTFTVNIHCEKGATDFHVHDDPGVGLFPASPDLFTFDRVVRFSGSITGVPENLPPIADICRDVRAECEGVTTPVALDGTCSSDPEGGTLSYLWSSPTGTFADPASPTPTGQFPRGVNGVSLVVTDPEGAPSAPDTGLVVVADTTPPVVTCGVSRTALWPANHQMIDVGLSLSIEEACDPDPDVQILVTSDEHPANVAGAGGATHCPDAIVGTDRSVQLRAERSGTEDGRVYRITVRATDDAGLSGTCTATVTVRKSSGPGGSAVDSGQFYDPTNCHAGGVLPPAVTPRVAPTARDSNRLTSVSSSSGDAPETTPKSNR